MYQKNVKSIEIPRTTGSLESTFGHMKENIGHHI
jgi:hypothetical protein